METIIGLLENNRVTNRAVFASYEAAQAILMPGTFVEETEETGPLHFGGYWDGEKFTPPTEQEAEDFRAYLDAKYNSQPVVEEATPEITE